MNPCMLLLQNLISVLYVIGKNVFMWQVKSIFVLKLVFQPVRVSFLS